MRIHSWTVLSHLLLVGCVARGDEPPRPDVKVAMPDGLAKRVQDLAEAVLTHSVDPPARQQMILTGIKALHEAAGLPAPIGLGRRVSTVATPEQLSGLLAETWPSKPGKEMTTERLEEALLEGMLRDVPGGGGLMTAKEQRVREQLQGNRYVGIHIQVRYDEKEGRTIVAGIIPGGPADRAGMMVEDRIEAVDGVKTDGMKIAQVIDRLRGEDGTEVTVTVRQSKDKEARTLTMARGKLFQPTILGLIKKSSGEWEYRVGKSEPIAIVRIGSLGASTPHELRKLAGQFEDQDVRALILDLRQLSSTALHPAVLLADALLERGRIGRMRTADRPMTYDATPDALFAGWPIAVLVDAGTSGTAEWVAAALQDNHRAVLVGAPIQSGFPFAPRNMPMPNTSEVRSTVPVGDGDRFLDLVTGLLERGDGRPLRAPRSRPDGTRIPLQRPGEEADKAVPGGVKPDHIVNLPRGARGGRGPQGGAMKNDQPRPDPAEDPVLEKAIEVLHKALEKS
jgi:carboxyl-terminal processing protease